MKVKRDEDGFYKVEGAKYVRIRAYYELYVRKISSNDGNDTIFFTYKLETLKNFLAQYETEKDLLADYYIARLEGKYHLDFYETRR